MASSQKIMCAFSIHPIPANDIWYNTYLENFLLTRSDLHTYLLQLLLRKAPSNTGTKASALKPIVQRRFNRYDARDWRGLVADYEDDVIAAGHLHCVDRRTKEDAEEAQIRAAADLLSQFQCSKARKLLQSNGLGDHINPKIVAQMKRKHPKRKKLIAGLTAEQLEAPRKGLSMKVFGAKLRGLKHDVALGFGCLRNEHLLALNLNPARQ